MRFFSATIMNLIAAGTGLMRLGRPWLGLALAVWFTLGLELWICGVMIAPAVIPRWIAVGGAVLALLAWVAAQWVLIQRWRFLRSPSLPDELAMLRGHATAAIAAGDHKAARAALEIAIGVDDQDLETRVLWARLLSATTRPERARRAWRRVARLDGAGRFQAEIRSALARS